MYAINYLDNGGTVETVEFADYAAAKTAFDALLTKPATLVAEIVGPDDEIIEEAAR